MNVQGGIIIALLSVLVAIGIKTSFLDTSPANDSAPAGFTVTPIGAGQYVMRAREKIFFCKGNQCTGIKLITTPAQAAAPSQPAEAQTTEPSG
ncbi:MAG: hypothetical protein E2O54_16145 [Gammaproteobacteria bacterium]|nr:MAG: hypothetical protein E2O54_16145 [Gammaproteobacteria bacterium]